MDNMNNYKPPLALTVISGICLALGAVCAIGIAVDIILRKGWQSMMGIMIPVYIINATYLGPFAVYIYYRFGRPSRPTHSASDKPKELPPAAEDLEKSVSSASSSQDTTAPKGSPIPSNSCCASRTPGATETPSKCHDPTTHDEQAPTPAPHACCTPTTRPFWATVTVGVFHCGAGCVLGDAIGEWLVYGSGARIAGRMIWVELLIDYSIALLFGIIFQYFSIAPMSGQWGPMTLWRAAKADVASLTSFEIGCFGWMIAFQVGIFGGRLGMRTWSYWWLMQVGMCMGVLTAWPANWWLITHNVKEACC